MAEGVSCPSLVISGEFDATCPPALGLQMARVLRTEQILLPDIGHMPMLECPDRISRLLECHFEFSERLAAAAT
jgi:pimeloyl-ACP methyl ester carboxylesterase